MSKFVYLVEVETERDSGLIASRDEQSELIIEALQDTQVYIEGIGARSDSSYSVTEISVEELDSEALRELHKTHQRRVVEETPGDEELRKELKKLRSDLKESERLAERLKSQVTDLTEAREALSTRIYQTGGALAPDSRTYIDDEHPVYFQIGDSQEIASVRLQKAEIEIMYQGFGQMVLIPRSGNVVLVKSLGR